MKALIIADLEGIIGIKNIYDKEHCETCLCKELLKYVKYLKTNYSGVEITICDCHNNGQTILALQNILSECHIVSCVWNIDFDIIYDFALLVGFHAMSMKSSPFSHSFRPEIRQAKLGLKTVGELSLFANYLFYYNIPLLFAGGDAECIDEISYMPCGKFSTSNRPIEILYKQLDDYLGTALINTIPFIQYRNENVSIEFFNSDLIDILSRKGYKEYNEKYIKFENVFYFFQAIQTFCYDIIQSVQYIYKRNTKILKDYILKYGQTRVHESIQKYDRRLLCQDISKVPYEVLKKALENC